MRFGLLSTDLCLNSYLCFFFNDPTTTEIYTLSLHDALPIYGRRGGALSPPGRLLLLPPEALRIPRRRETRGGERSEEHTSELQSHSDLVCRLLLEKKKQNPNG